MVPKPFLVLVLSVFLAACGYGNGGSDGGDHDGKTQDGTNGGDDVAIECTPSVDRCPVGLDCLCCGSIGPTEQCICSMACNSNADCTHPDLPECNQPGPDIAGICTPVDYFCCWGCQ